MQDRADVIVVGGGGSGLCAAIEAASLGRSVILLEKTGALGGSTTWAVGSLSATSTPHQIARGIKDFPALHFEDLPKFDHSRGRLTAGHGKPTDRQDNEALRRLLTDAMPDMLRWLMSLGIEFIGPMEEPPHRVARMHNVVPNSRAYSHHLGRAARKLGVDIRLGTAVSRLVVDGEHVTGVALQSKDGMENILHADGGVILTCGDYSAGTAYKDRFLGPEVAAIKPVNPSNTGDGHRMAEALGASIINGHVVNRSVRFIPQAHPSWIQRLPPSRLVGRMIRLGFDLLPAAVIRPFIMNFVVTTMGLAPGFWTGGAVQVNKHGRFVPIKDGDRVATFLGEPDHEVYFLLDSAVADKFEAWPNFISTAPGIAYAYVSDYRRGRRDLFRQAATIDELARKAGMEPEALRAAAAQLANARAMDATLGPVEPPFALVGPATVYVTTTDGGLAVDGTLRVVRSDGTPIAGLYAAGATGQGGVLLPGHGHHLGWAFVSGRVAGRQAALAAVSV